MVPRACFVCGSVVSTPLELSSSLSYRCCKDCGHCSLLSENDDKANTFLAAQEQYYGEASALLNSELVLFEKESLAERFAIISRFLSVPADVLEVGPGGGHVLEWLQQQGHHVFAVEHAPALVQGLKERLGLPVFMGEFETMNLGPESFDVFCSFHVIEHVPDPLVHLAKAFSLVRPGGIAFIATPNACSWQQLVFPILSPNFDSAHLHVFSPRSLRMLCEQVGWTIVETLTPETTSGWARVLTRVLRRIRNEDVQETAGKYVRASSPTMRTMACILQLGTLPFRFVQRSLGRGNEVFVVLRKL